MELLSGGVPGELVCLSNTAAAVTIGILITINIFVMPAVAD